MAEHMHIAFGGTVARSSSCDWFEALKKMGRRENFHTLMHAHLFQVWIAGNEDAGPGIDGQRNELVIGGITVLNGMVVSSSKCNIGFIWMKYRFPISLEVK